jgi:hypothetical protein
MGKRNSLLMKGIFSIVLAVIGLAAYCSSRLVMPPAWKTIKLGTGLISGDDFRRALKADGFQVSDYISDILVINPFMDLSRTMSRGTEIDLVNISVAELGFKKEAAGKQIYERATKLGLQICPIEVALQLRLQYRDQPKGESLFVAMIAIPDLHGNQIIFVEEHGDLGPALYSRFWNSRYTYYGNERWVFVRPRRQLPPHKTLFLWR